MRSSRLDPTLVGVGLAAAVAGWFAIETGWYPASFAMYALTLASVGFVGGAATGNLFVAPVGLLVGEFLGLVRVPRFLLFDLIVVVASLSIALLAGLVGRAVRRAPSDAS